MKWTLKQKICTGLLEEWIARNARKQNFDIQDHHPANMDLWYRTLELFMQIKCKYYSEILIKIPKNNHKCPMVYIKQTTP